jgi:hypothetical protein
MSGGQGAHSRPLVEARFNDQHAAGSEQTGGVAQNGSVSRQSTRPAVESRPGIVRPHFGREPRDDAGWNIGRVRDDEIEAGVKGRPPIGRDEHGAIANPIRNGVTLGYGERAGRAVDADADRARQLAQKRDEQAARPGSEVQEASGRAAVWRVAQGRFDDGLRVGPRHEGFGREPERQSPELPAADDARHRLARQPAGGPSRESTGALLADRRLRLGRERGGVDPERLQGKDAGVERRAVEAGFGEGLAQPRQSLRARRDGRKPVQRLRGRRCGQATPSATSSAA